MVPLIVFRESLQYNYFFSRFREYDMTGNVAMISTILSVFFIALSVLFIWLILKKSNFRIAKSEILWITTIYFGLYILLSYLVTGVVAGKIMSNHVLYVANLIIILLLLKRKLVSFTSPVNIRKSSKPFFLYLVAVVAVILILAIVSVSIHEELAGAHNRFG